jgi:hypothetical protein
MKGRLHTAGMYLVACTKVLVDRCHYLSEKASSIAITDVDPKVRYIIYSSLSTLSSPLLRMGSLHINPQIWGIFSLYTTTEKAAV